MKYKFFVFLAIGIISFFSTSLYVSAHVLKVDGSVGVVMHIDPEDSPIAGLPATFFFEIKDTQKKFKSENCVCVVSIYQNQTQIYSYSLFENKSEQALSVPVFSFTFPEKSIYTVHFKGRPKNDQMFQYFSFDYSVRVDSQLENKIVHTVTENKDSGNHFFHFLIFGSGFFALFVLRYLEIRKQRRKIQSLGNNPATLKILITIFLLGSYFFHASVLDAAHSHHFPVFAHHDCCNSPVIFVPTLFSAKPIMGFEKIYTLNVTKVINTSARFLNNKSPPELLVVV